MSEDFSGLFMCLQDRSAFWPDGCGSDNCARPDGPPPTTVDSTNRDLAGVELVAREDSRPIAQGRAIGLAGRRVPNRQTSDG